jgi:formylglycine-generating enzyme required for sulfatase activity
MAVTFEQFVKQLEVSGILAGDTLKDFIPPKASPKDAEELARELVRKKKLTKFQAEEVYRGKGKSLVLGNYVLMEKIGAGGMGQVFKAEHRRLKRVVAVKLLPAAMTNDKAAIARFEREVEAAAKLRHPNIVAADDADKANGIHFLVMELVDGSDLSALVKKDGPLPVEKAANYILQAAKGLEAAHAAGIVHRDIKPANLLLDKAGTVKILDMGLARLSASGDAPTAAELTSSVAVMGTVDYIAPEQALSTKTADARADIYSLGCSLHYLLTGKATYEGDTLMSKLLAHREQPIPSLRAARPEVPEQLEVVFKKMLAKKVEVRFQTMTEVVAALEAIPSREPASTVNSEEATAWVHSAEERKKLGKAGAPKPLTPLVQVVASEKSKHSFAKIAGGAFATIITTILVTFLIKYLERDDSPPKPPVVAVTALPAPPGAGEAKNHEPPLPAIAPFDAKQAVAYQEAWARHLGTKVEIENSLGMKLRLIPPGEFVMGSPKEEIDALVATTSELQWQDWFRCEGPQHRVKLTQAFYLGSCEVTQLQYQEVMGVNPSHYSPTGPGKEDFMNDTDTAQHPVERVSWFDAIDFCNKLSEKEKRSPYYSHVGEVVKVLGGTGYRLPAEAEWECACRAGTTTRWSFGDNESNLPKHAWIGSKPKNVTHPVAGLPANPLGLYDLYGNVWEWCWDWHGAYANGAVSDPTGPAAEVGVRVLRGGAFDCYSSVVRSAGRVTFQPSVRSISYGFRVSRTYP